MDSRQAWHKLKGTKKPFRWGRFDQTHFLSHTSLKPRQNLQSPNALTHLVVPWNCVNKDPRIRPSQRLTYSLDSGGQWCTCTTLIRNKLQTKHKGLEKRCYSHSLSASLRHEHNCIAPPEDVELDRDQSEAGINNQSLIVTSARTEYNYVVSWRLSRRWSRIIPRMCLGRNTL